MESLRGIGRMSRESGLTVSALRFYDGAGVLSPARVDPHTGYRFYAPEQLAVARVVAVLRRVGMPLAGIRDVLARRHDPDAVDALLAEHVHRLEQGLADARSALSSVRSLIDPQEPAMSPTVVTVLAAELAAALRAVRFAAGSTDPGLPGLAGVLVEVDPGARLLTAVATDRYRLAVASVPAVACDGPAASGVVPVALVDEMLAGVLGGAAHDVTVTIDGTHDGAAVRVRAGATTAGGPLLPDAFPEYRRLLPAARTGVPVDPGALRAAVASAPVRTMTREPDGVEFEVAALGLGPDGGLTVAGGDVGVNREFLLEAVDAGGPGQLVLELDGPLSPLVIRSAGSLSLLMPVRL